MRGSTPRRWPRAGNHTALPQVGRSQYEKVAFAARGATRLRSALPCGGAEAVPSIVTRHRTEAAPCDCAEEGTAWAGRPRLSLSVPDSPPEGALVGARTSFLVDDPVDADVVREPILASWTRSREWNIDVDGRGALGVRHRSRIRCSCARPAGAGLGRRRARRRAGERHPLRRRRRGAQRRTGDSALSQALDRIWLAPGFSYSEKFVGTNGIGTALEGRGPGRGLRPRALRGAAGGVRLRGRARPAPGERQGARRHRPDVLAPGRRALHVHGGGPHRAADRGRAAGAVRARASWRCCTTT